MLIIPILFSKSKPCKDLNTVINKIDKNEITNNVPFSEINITTLFSQMSQARSDRYVNATKDAFTALHLYQLNGDIGAKLWVPLQHCEVVLRNIIDKALCKAFSGEWMGNIAFHRLIKQHKRTALETSISKYTDGETGVVNRNKVVADLPLSFWEEILSPKFIPLVWKKYTDDIFSDRDKNQDVDQFINSLYQQIKRIRQLRNRIAHHEPIFPRKIDSDWAALTNVIKCCSCEFHRLALSYQASIYQTSREISGLLMRKNQ